VGGKPGARLEGYRQLIGFCLDPVRHSSGTDHVEHHPHLALVYTYPNLPYEGVVQQQLSFHLAGSDPEEIDHDAGRIRQVKGIVVREAPVADKVELDPLIS
jgi:hypothetical protein